MTSSKETLIPDKLLLEHARTALAKSLLDATNRFFELHLAALLVDAQFSVPDDYVERAKELLIGWQVRLDLRDGHVFACFVAPEERQPALEPSEDQPEQG